MIHLTTEKIKNLVFVNFIVLTIMFSTTKTYSQYNLVPNPSFELFDTCPDWNNTGFIRFAKYWSNPLHLTSPDYFNSCDTGTYHYFSVPGNFIGNQFAHSGNAYAGIIAYNENQINPLTNNYREYIQTILTDSLTAGIEYCFSFHVSVADSSGFFCNSLGLYFSNSQILDSCPQWNPCPLSYIPQFQNNIPLTNDSSWTLVAGSLIASGGEKYIVIGNFLDSTNSFAIPTGLPLSQHYYAYYYIDDILITPCDSLMAIPQVKNQPQIYLYPNPSGGIYYIVGKGLSEIIGFEVFDSLGKLIHYKHKDILPVDDIDLSDFSQGLYLIRLLSVKGFHHFKVLKK